MIVPRIASLVAALVFTASVDLFAQPAPPVAPGDRVRVTAPTIDRDPLVGTLVSLGADTCVLEVEGRAEPLALSLAPVTSLEVSRGKKSRILVGAGLGFVVGAVGSALWWTSVQEADDTSVLNPYALVGFGGGGLLLGSLVGSLVEVDRWEVVPLDQLRVGLVRQRSGRLGVTISSSIRV